MGKVQKKFYIRLLFYANKNEDTTSYWTKNEL